jgi:acyl carrier protein
VVSGVSSGETKWEESVGETTEQVIGIVSEKLGVDKDKVKPDASFVGDLGADSLDMVELLMNLEDNFKMTIPDEDAENIKTVGDAVKYIDEHKNQQDA